uniref:Uncharacterized protein n=2 Tax=Ursus TaxID=9639 RepID=A0A452THB6_URSMA
TNALKKMVLVAQCGRCVKTLCSVLSKNQSPGVYVPTVFENHAADVKVDEKQVESNNGLRKSSISVSTHPSACLGTRRVFRMRSPQGRS